MNLLNSILEDIKNEKFQTMVYQSDSVGSVDIKYSLKRNKVFFSFINKDGDEISDFITLKHGVNPESAIFNYLKSINY